MNVFVTGATGFIGLCLVHALLEEGHSVTAMTRPARTPDSRLPSNCKQVPLELTDVERLTRAISACDAVIYGAGSVRGRSAEDFMYANVKGIEAMVTALERLPEAPPLLLVSSLAASRPEVSDYAFTKHMGEQLLLSQPGLAWTILRPSAVYGPGDKEMLPVLKMARQGLLLQAGPDNQRLSLIHVDDLTSAMLFWLGAIENCQHKIYAIDDGQQNDSDRGYDWPAICAAVSDKKVRRLKIPQAVLKMAAKCNVHFSRLAGFQPMLTPGKARELTQQDWLANNEAFSSDTGWQPALDLKAGARLLFSTQK